jgi:prepilin-type N-terminal cleavage/methylation domain-containing protein
MFIRRALLSRNGFTLVEVLVAMGLAGVLVAVVALLAYFTSRSYAAATNYTDMALLSRMGLDGMSRTIRRAKQVVAYGTNSITLQDTSGSNIVYSFNSANGTLTCLSGGQTNTYLTGCDRLQFWLYQRTPISNTFDCYAPAAVTNAKLVQVTWTCSRQILGAKVNTEAVESAKICLRNH